MTDHSMVQRDPGTLPTDIDTPLEVGGLPPTTDPWRPQMHVPPQHTYVSIKVAQQMIEAGTKGGVEAALLQNLELTGKLTNSEISRGILGAMLEQLVREVRVTGAVEFIRGDLMERCVSALNVHAR